MAKNVTRMVQYQRDRSATNDKFAGLRTVIADASARNMATILVDAPEALGDTYEELIANLNAIAAADLSLMIVPPRHRA